MGPAAAERAGIALLTLLMNRLRSRDWPLADAEVSELLLEPLRQLADAAKLQSTHNRGALRERLTLFGVRLGDCVDKADVIVKKMAGGGAALGRIQLRLHGAVAAARHSPRLAIAVVARAVDVGFEPEEVGRRYGRSAAIAADGRLRARRRDPRIRQVGEEAAEIWREIDREPGWRGQLARRRRQGGSRGSRRRLTRPGGAPATSARRHPS